ncbi:hypothetical protein HYR99_04885 [Candidatus Poribacteria bacterium]|nr:hypothetical protein [Candidatus Poribacteria bacterium]
MIYHSPSNSEVGQTDAGARDNRGEIPFLFVASAAILEPLFVVSISICVSVRAIVSVSPQLLANATAISLFAAVVIVPVILTKLTRITRSRLFLTTSIGAFATSVLLTFGLGVLGLLNPTSPLSYAKPLNPSILLYIWFLLRAFIDRGIGIGRAPITENDRDSSAQRFMSHTAIPIGIIGLLAYTGMSWFLKALGIPLNQFVNAIFQSASATIGRRLSERRGNWFPKSPPPISRWIGVS